MKIKFLSRQKQKHDSVNPNNHDTMNNSKIFANFNRKGQGHVMQTKFFRNDDFAGFCSIFDRPYHSDFS